MVNGKLAMLKNKRVKIAIISFSLTTLIAMYLLQNINFAGYIFNGSSAHPFVIFVLNKTFRLFINDTACFMLIWALFRESKYLRLSFYVFLLETLVILPLYFCVKLSVEGDSEISSPLLSQIHRLIVNPTLMILLMVGFVYQRFQYKFKDSSNGV